MARGTTLGQCVNLLRGEVGASLNPNFGINTTEIYKQRLRAQQERLYREHDWPFLIGSYDVPMAAGQRYYDLPVDAERVQNVETKWTDLWEPVDFGIRGEDYNAHDSDNDERLDPVLKWDFYRASDTATQDQFEVWPIPATNSASTVRFWGMKALAPFIEEDDRADLDDHLIVLFAAATLIKDKKDRDLKLAEATSYMATLKAKSSGTRRMFVLGGEQPYIRRPGPVRVGYITTP